MATITVKDANNLDVPLEKPLVPGRALAAASRPVVLSSEDLAVLSAIVDAIEASGGGGGGGSVTIADSALSEYETVAASATDQALGATGASGDYLSGVLIVPASTSPGAVSIKDGAGAAITIFTGGATSVSNLVPFFVPLGIKSMAGPWKLSTGANVSALASGNFS
jgi:hypothetical protein